MPAATAAAFTGIHNENEFYSHRYLSEIFSGDIPSTVDRWRESAEAGGEQEPYVALRALAGDYVRFRRDFDREPRSGRRLNLQRAWFRQLLPALGYEWAPANHALDDGDEVPVLSAAGRKAGPALLALGAYDPDAESEDPLELKPHPLQFHGEAPPPEALLSETWDEVVTRRCFGQDHPPRWLQVLSFSRVLLIERGEWTHNRLLRFDLDEILGRREDATLKAAAALLHRDSLLPRDGRSLLDSLDENSHKHAFAVSEDLEYALRESIELIGNEAIPGNVGGVVGVLGPSPRSRDLGAPRSGIKGDIAWTLRRRNGVAATDAALGWEDVRRLREGIVTRHITDDTLPGRPVERVIEYHAPFDRCDGEDNYDAAWTVFRSRFAPPNDSPLPHPPTVTKS